MCFCLHLRLTCCMWEGGVVCMYLSFEPDRYVVRGEKVGMDG